MSRRRPGPAVLLLLLLLLFPMAAAQPPPPPATTEAPSPPPIAAPVTPAPPTTPVVPGATPVPPPPPPQQTPAPTPSSLGTTATPTNCLDATLDIDAKQGLIRCDDGGNRTFAFGDSIKLTIMANENSRFQVSSAASASLKSLSITTTAQGAATRPVVTTNQKSFEELPALESLTFDNLNFIRQNVTLFVPANLAQLRVISVNINDLSLATTDASALYVVEFANNAFTGLPQLFYERQYKKPLRLISDTISAGNMTQLSKSEFANAKANMNGVAGFAFVDDCAKATPAPNVHTICLDGSRSGVRGNRLTGGPQGGLESGSGSRVGAVPAPAPSTRKSGDTTLTIVVIIIALVAAVLAYIVAKRYFCASGSASRSPRAHDPSVGLIGKEDAQAAAAGKQSFISSDDCLRPHRLEQQDVSLNKSLGPGRLWVGDYDGRKVVIKRVEAENSDSHVTKALIHQARSLVGLSHPNIVSVIGVTWVQGTDFGIVAEFVDKGTLKALLMDMEQELTLQAKFHLGLDIAHALVYLHGSDRNLCMRRLNSRKVLVNAEMECKLNVLECQPNGTKLDAPELYGAGEMAWWAPELVLRSGGAVDTRKANIFALGVLLCEIFTRATPYQSRVDAVGHTLADLELARRIRQRERLAPHENRREFHELPSMVRDLVERCLSYTPMDRPTAEDVVACLETAKGYSERMGSTTSL